MKKFILSLIGGACIVLMVLFALPSNQLVANDQISQVDCNCGLIWGEGCSASNHGNSCAPDDASLCSPYDSNCD